MTAVKLTMLLYTGLMLVFFIVFIIVFFRHRKRVRPFVRFALIPAVAVILIDVSLFVIRPEILSATNGPAIVCVDVIAFARLIVFGAVGMFCAAALARPYAPLLRKIFRRRRHCAAGLLRGLLPWVLAIVVLGVAYSWVLFTWIPVRLSSEMRELLEQSPLSAPLAMQPSLLAALAMLEFALAEEVAFRLGIQNYLAYLFKLRGDKYWIAVLFSAVLWSAAHANVLEPGWAKVLQVLPLGIALGLLYRRYGVEACILTHGLFNLIMMMLAPSLIRA
jgi:membrane protease YdiL (CAAX protease family)